MSKFGGHYTLVSPLPILGTCPPRPQGLRLRLRCGDLRSPRVMERRNGSLGLHDDDDDDDEDDLCQKWRVKLVFRRTYRMSGTGIAECLKIIDVGCNLKQFDEEADRRCILDFRSSTKMPTEMNYHFWPKKRERRSPVPISQNLVRLRFSYEHNISAQRK